MHAEALDKVIARDSPSNKTYAPARCPPSPPSLQPKMDRQACIGILLAMALVGLSTAAPLRLSDVKVISLGKDARALSANLLKNQTDVDTKRGEFFNYPLKYFASTGLSSIA